MVVAAADDLINDEVISKLVCSFADDMLLIYDDGEYLFLVEIEMHLTVV